eukprot:5240186-Alexandrium_andersonii.AAC.1
MARRVQPHQACQLVRPHTSNVPLSARAFATRRQLGRQLIKQHASQKRQQQGVAAGRIKPANVKCA